MRKEVYVFILAFIITIPIVLLTSSCKNDEVSPVGTTHTYSGSWRFVDSTSVDTTRASAEMIINVDGDYNFQMGLYNDTLLSARVTDTIKGNVNTSGQLNGAIIKLGVQIGTLSGTLQGNTGGGTYSLTGVPNTRKWGTKKN